MPLSRKRVIAVLRLPVIRPTVVALLRALLFPRMSRTTRGLGNFTVMQVGGRGGADPLTGWLYRRKQIRTVGVEPESSGLQRITATRAFTFVATQALSDRTGTAQLYVTHSRACSSLLEPDERAAERVMTAACAAVRPFQVVATEEVPVTTLDALLPQLPPVDYLQIDVQGAELQVLRGAQATLTHVPVMELEMRFYPLYQQEPLFWEIHTYLDHCGFQLCQMVPQGESEFGSDKLVEVNAVYYNRALMEQQPLRVHALCQYAAAKHRLYGNRLLRLLGDLESSLHLTTHVVGQ